MRISSDCLPRAFAFLVTVAVVALLPGAISLATASASPGALAAPGDDPDGWTMMPSGLLGPADRDLLIKVRLAGLWEQPAGDMAVKRAVSPKVKEIGRKISAEHHTLDNQVREVAGQLGVDLPNEPNADQQTWLAEMTAAQGDRFDLVFVARLRAAHGKVFSTIAAVRAGTRNDLVRSFAATANAAVLRHMQYLEGSGLVDYGSLPTPPAPAGSVTVANVGGRSVDPLVIWVVLAAAGIAGIITTAKVVRAR